MNTAIPQLLQKHPALTASALGLVLATLPYTGHAAAGDIPPEVLKQLETLSRQVEQLQKQVNQQQQQVTVIFQHFHLLAHPQPHLFCAGLGGLAMLMSVTFLFVMIMAAASTAATTAVSDFKYFAYFAGGE